MPLAAVVVAATTIAAEPAAYPVLFLSALTAVDSSGRTGVEES